MAGTSHGNYLITLTPFLLFLTGGFHSNRPGFPVPGIPVLGLAILSYPGPGPGQVTFFIPVPVPVPVKSHFSSRSRSRSRSITQICRDFDRDLLHNFIHCDFKFLLSFIVNFIFKHPLSQIKCLKLLNKFE